MNGKRLKQVRKNRGYTQASLAEKLGVSKGTVTMWETGKRNPEFETLEELLSVLDVSYDYLTGKSDDEGCSIPSKEDLQQIAAWTIADDTYDKIKKYLALDLYGSNAVDNLISSEYKRCYEQKTLTDTSNYKITVSVDSNNIQV